MSKQIALSACVSDVVLVVEDEPAARVGMEQILNLAGYAAVSACNGQEALDLLRSGVPASVIVLDLMMPVMDGWAFRREQRRDPTLSHIPGLPMSPMLLTESLS